MKVLILGALPKDKEQRQLYESIIDAIKKRVRMIGSPIDTAKFIGSDSERYKRALGLVDQADLIIAEQSKPSTGQGIEIGYAAVLKKPLLVVAKRGSKISGLVKGCPALREIVFYDDRKDLASKLKNLFKKINLI